MRLQLRRDLSRYFEKAWRPEPEPAETAGTDEIEDREMMELLMVCEGLAQGDDDAAGKDPGQD